MENIGLFIVFGLIGLAAILYLNYCIAKEFGRIASEKGHDEKRYTLWCFFLGVIGMLMVCALPDWGKILSESAEKKSAVSDELPNL